MATKKDQGGEPKKRVVLGFLEEAAEFATGVLAGSAFSSILRVGASGLLKGLKGSLFERLFGKVRKQSEEAKAEDFEKAPKDFGEGIAIVSGDPKLGQLAQDYMAKVISIQAGNRPEFEKAEAIKREQEKYKAAVNEYLLGKTKQSLQNLLAELSDLDNDPKNAGRQKPYRKDFFDWLSLDLTPAQQEVVMIRRAKIASVRMITDMLEFSKDPVSRFRYLTFALGEPNFKELPYELYRTAMAGCLEEHPIVQRAEAWSRDNIAERQARAELMDCTFKNRRNV